MLPRSLPAGSVEELTFRLGNLEIGISVRRAPSPTRSDVETASSTGWEFVDQQEPVAVPLYEFPRSLEAAALRASTASELSGLPLDFLSPLARQLRGSDLTWTPRARIARAFKAGVLGALRLAGETSNQSSIRIPYRNTFYTWCCVALVLATVVGPTTTASTSGQYRPCSQGSCPLTPLRCHTPFRLGRRQKLIWPARGSHGHFNFNDIPPRRGGLEGAGGQGEFGKASILRRGTKRAKLQWFSQSMFAQAASWLQLLW